MKHLNKLFALILSVAFLSANAQERYMDEIFTSVDVTTDVIYGVNATILYVPVTGEAVPEALTMDVYEPNGDTETDRPVVIYLHTGNFLPHPQNGGASGTNRDSTAVEICSRLARMGYVVASINYRLGWNPIAPTQEERVNTLINAAYRGVQDGRTAVRYFRKNAAEGGNTFGIDPAKVVAWGQGTGGYIVMAMTSLDAYNKVLIPKFIGQDANGNPLPMVIEPIHGDVEAVAYGVAPNNDTLCYPNHVGYSSDISLSVNTGGAIGDTSWLDPGQNPMISFHTVSDPFAPYVSGTVIVPVVNLPVVDVQGSYLVQKLANDFGNNDVFKNYGFSDEWSDGPNMNNDGYDGLRPFIRPTGAEFDSAPWDFWDPVTNANHAAGLQTNPDMSAEKARMFIDSLVGYYAPRACAALSLGCSVLDAPVLDADAFSLQVSPNPAADFIRFETAKELIQEVYLYDINGRLVKAITDINTTNYTMNRNALANGVYIAQVRFEEGVMTRKVIFE